MHWVIDSILSLRCPDLLGSSLKSERERMGAAEQSSRVPAADGAACASQTAVCRSQGKNITDIPETLVSLKDFYGKLLTLNVKISHGDTTELNVDFLLTFRMT